MGIFDRFSLPNQSKKKAFELNSPKCSPIMGQTSTYKTLATFDLEVGTPRFTGDVPNAYIKSYEDINREF